MEPTCGLAEKFRDLLFDLIGEHLLYLIYYGQNLEQLNERLAKLTLERISIQHRIDEATNNVEQIEEKVLHWLHKVDEVSEQVEELRKAGQAKRECSLTSCPNPWLRYKLSKRAKAMAQQVADVCADAYFDIVSYRLPPQSVPELRHGESNEGIDSRVSIMNQILEALRNHNVNMVGLCGPGGVGKTTIAKEVEMKEKNQKMFEKVIWATVSDELNVGKIQRQIAEKLCMSLNEETEDVRAYRIWKRLEKEKNMLLILDDLWEEIDLRKVGIPFADFENYSKNNEGCKILLTSRNEALLSNRMKCQKIIKVDVLLDDEALELFKRINAKFSIGLSNPELISIATEIVQKCRGLPLAIATAAKALQEKDVDGWKDYLARWKNHLRRNITGIREVDASLKLSYDHLSRENKNIFLLSAMLSHDPSIGDLLMYSVGLDFLHDIENMEEAQVGISDIVRKLKSLNLFLDSFSDQYFTIHDVFRDAALSIASDELHTFISRHRTLKEWPDENRLEACKGIFLEESNISIELPEELDAPRLQFFLLNSTEYDLTIPNTFFKSSKELKLLSFTNLHFPLLPSLSFLQKLKALFLHSCKLEDITEVRSLKKLKVLSLAYSEIERLPLELVELTSLQVLNLSNCYKLKVIPEKLLSSFKKLEVLYMENSFDQWKVEGTGETNENASLDELKDLPISSLDIHIPDVSMLPENLFLYMNLKRYRILIGKCRQWWLGDHKTSKILNLELERGVNFKRWVQNLLEGVENLYLYGSNGLDNVLYNHEGRGFPHLRHLEIESNDDIKYIVLKSAHHEDAFPILESLILQNLKALEKLCEGTDTIVFHQLRILKMINLPALSADLCLKDGAINNISNKMFISVFSKMLLPKLEILELSYLNIEQLPHNPLRELKTLIVRKCAFVKLLPLHVLKYLNNLEELEIEGCDMLKAVFDFEDSNDYKEIETSLVVVPLKTLKLLRLAKLKNVWSNHYQRNVSFPSLRRVHVSYCESLTSIFPASIAKDMLRNLEELQISECGIYVIVANDRASESATTTFEFPKLTSLELYKLPGLRFFYPQRHAFEWPNLQRLYIEYCGKLEIFEKEVSGSPEIHIQESMLNSNYPQLSRDQVFHNLEELTLHVKMIGSGMFTMYHFPKVKMLYLSVHNATISYKSLRKSFPNLEVLVLSRDFEEALETNDVVGSYSQLALSHMSNMRSLSPSLVSSQNLTYLRVSFCQRLTTLMTSSTAQSLVHLTYLSIDVCYKMEEIITKQEGENDEDKEIIFSKLKEMYFDDMPRLRRFCGYNYTFRFPLLEEIILPKCPKFKIFSPGFIDTPSLKSVRLSNDSEERHEIWDTNLNKTFNKQPFVASREMVLDKCDVSMIRNDQFPVELCSQVEILGIERLVDDEWVTLLERFPKLNELCLKDCSFEEIFPSHAPSLTSFHNLTTLKVSRCHLLVHLLTNSTAKSLVNLEILQISNCENLKEIVKKETNEDVEKGEIIFNGLRILKLKSLPRLNTEDFNIEGRATDTGFISLFGHNKVLLPKLEILELSNLLKKSISLIWDEQLIHNSFSNLKMLTINCCGSLKWVPFHVVKSLNMLEKLQVSDCDMLEMVFGLEDVNDGKEMESSSVVVPLNLTHLEVESCQPLTTLMTSSAARSLVHLTHLSIYHCYLIKEIITKQEGQDEEDNEIIFRKLELLELVWLPRLKTFCSHDYTFSFSLLESATIEECPQLTMFSPGAIHAPLLKSIQVENGFKLHTDIWMTDLNDTIQHRFNNKEVISTAKSMALNTDIILRNDVFPEVMSLYVESFTDEGVTFPYSSLQRFPKLDCLYVEHCSFEEIFPSLDHITDDFMEEISPFEGLRIAYLDKLKSIWKDDSQLPPIHQNLEVLQVICCSNLLKLAPSSVSFQCLNRLTVSGCHQLIHLVTSSTAKSLVSLEMLKLNDCKNMEEIVMNETSEDAEGIITFNRLCEIKLTDMSSLKMFSSQSHTFQFPKLKELKIRGCPEMKMFCPRVLKTPKLSNVKIEEHEMEWNDEGDLNKTIQEYTNGILSEGVAGQDFDT